MAEIRFAIAGAGWRARFYIRAALSYSDLFSLTAVLCRSAEREESLKKEFPVKTVRTQEELLQSRPDFVVVCTSKISIAEVSLSYLEKNIPVLCETPAGMTEEDLEKIRDAHTKGGRIFVAEQYPYLKSFRMIKEKLDSGILGERDFLYLSRAHEYHAFSLMRLLLDPDPGTRFTVSAFSFLCPVARTADRYNEYTDGKIKESVRNTAVISFENGKTCLYDFESEQYHSSIRNYCVRLSGRRGEYKDGVFTYLDSENRRQRETIDIENDSDEEALKILLEKVSSLFKDKKAGEEESLMLENALEDACFAILLRKSLESERKRWNGK